MHHDDDPASLVLAEESLSTGKRRVITGRVRIRSETETVETAVRAELEGESVEVHRVPVNRPIDALPPVRTDGDLTIFPVVEEVLVVEKQLYLKEEIHIRRRATREAVDIPVARRRQRAIVERIDPETGDVAIETLPTSEDETHE
jgi:uncharacterized protein (TIGR02271 family)